MSLLDTGVSLIHPYYKDEKRLALHLKIWEAWSPTVCSNVDITLVDDGSPTPLTLTDNAKAMLKDKGIKLSVYRILEDLKWNTPGALNLGVMVAPRPWVVFMDSDCFFESAAWEKILALSPPLNKYWKFPRKRLGDPKIENLKLDRYLPCTMLMHKQIFMNLGGFDEDFTGSRSGGYGFFDNEFDSRSWPKEFWSEKHHVLTDIVAGEWMPSCCGDPVQRADDNHIVNKHLMYAKQKKEIPQNRQILNFPWQQVYTNWL